MRTVHKIQLAAIAALTVCSTVLWAQATTRPSSMTRGASGGEAFYPNKVAWLVGTSTVTRDNVVVQPGMTAFSRIVPTSSYLLIDTGFTSVTAVTATLNQAPALTCNSIYTTQSAGLIAVRTTKPTGSGDVTPIAATTAASVSLFVAGQ